jgi:AraC-like DNA-binding protein
MLSDPGTADATVALKFATTLSADAAEFTASSRISTRLPGSSQEYEYRLRDRALWRRRFDRPIFALADRGAGAIAVCFAENRFGTEVTLGGDEASMFVVALPTRGALTLVQDGAATTADAAGGLVMRPSPRARVLFSDDCTRANVAIKVTEVEAALRHALDRDLRRPLEFAPGMDWTRGLAASLRRQLDAVIAEFRSRDGAADNPVALAALTELLVALLLRAVPHSYSEEMDVGASCAVPAYVRRGEAFMRANGDRPIRMAEVAVAAGCSVRNLNDVFRRFRGTTPLAALHAIRLDAVREALRAGGTGESASAVARRHGFTNLARFAAAYRRRFGEAPSETAQGSARM